MNLADAISHVIFGTKFTLHQYIVLPLWNKDQPTIAEKAVTIMAQGYITMGGGFSHCMAGQHMGSSSPISDEDWDGWTEWAYNNSELNQRLDKVISDADELQERLALETRLRNAYAKLAEVQRLVEEEERESQRLDILLEEMGRAADIAKLSAWKERERRLREAFG
ncbi:MAG: hypothetical protein MMC23_001332 [Stictis urceolatum]|nr:hypothetical protein [Stictis urceolata]